MNILITGTTGLIGKELAWRLFRDGHDITVLSRNPVAAQLMLGLPARYEFWDGTNLNPAVLNGVDAVVHMAGHPVASGRWTNRIKKLIHDSRATGTRSLVQAMATLGDAAPKIFVCASATGFYGDRGDELLAEDAAPGEDFLAAVCGDWESAALAAEKIGARVVSLRFGVVLGLGGALARMLPPFRMGLGGRLGNGKQWMSWIHVDDVVGLILHAINTQDMRGAVNAVSPNSARNADFTRALGQALNKPTAFPVPTAALKLAFGEMGSVLLSSQRVEPKQALQSGYTFRFSDLNMALADVVDGAGCGKFVSRLWVQCAREDVFALCSDPHILAKISPPELGFKNLTSPPPSLGENAVIDYRVKLRGIPLLWRSKIVDWRPPEFFADLQLKGPNSEWRHEHIFVASRGGTIITDRIRYKLRGGALAMLALGGLATADMERTFAYRRRKMAEMLSPTI